jgi:hypothetical protein
MSDWKARCNTHASFGPFSPSFTSVSFLILYIAVGYTLHFTHGSVYEECSPLCTKQSDVSEEYCLHLQVEEQVKKEVRRK